MKCTFSRLGSEPTHLGVFTPAEVWERLQLLPQEECVVSILSNQYPFVTWWIHHKGFVLPFKNPLRGTTFDLVIRQGANTGRAPTSRIHTSNDADIIWALLHSRLVKRHIPYVQNFSFPVDFLLDMPHNTRRARIYLVDARIAWGVVRLTELAVWRK